MRLRLRLRFLLVSLLVLFCLFGTGMPFATFAATDSGPLTLKQRVEYQKAIEQVYWNHRLWPKENQKAKPALAEVMSDSMIEAKVEDALRKSNALEKYWNRPITAEQLQAEINRMVKQTKQPSVLKELFAALGNDPAVIAEALVRPVLSERLLANLYASDDRFHGQLKENAASELKRFPSVDSMRSMNGTYQEIEYVKKEDSVSDATVGKGRENTISLDAESWKELLSRLSNRARPALDVIAKGGLLKKNSESQKSQSVSVGKLSTLQEDQDAFYVQAVLEKGTNRLKVATVSWQKDSLDAWWKEASASVYADIAAPVSSYTLQTAQLSGSGANDTWAPTLSPFPERRYNHTAVWTGSEMIIWGGIGNGTTIGTGVRYSPSTDSWMETSSTNSPEARSYHTAVWTGSEMIIWGGGPSPSGARYNPLTDTWIATSNVDAAQARSAHTAVWAGTEMIIWGGIQADGPMATGGRYNPSRNSWTEINSADAPEARFSHTAIWTGSEMIIWGGTNYTNSLASGAQYNPSTNSWTDTNSADAPQARNSHVAVWTGSEMIVWGGQFRDTTGNNGVLATGARYNPSSNTWMATEETTAPEARYAHTAVWTGSEMIGWGGSPSTFSADLNVPAAPGDFIVQLSPVPAKLPWFYKPPVNGDIYTVAKNYDSFVLTKTDEAYREDLRSKGAPGPFLQYLLSNQIHDPESCTTQPVRNQVADRIGDFCDISANHPDWFLLDGNGNRIFTVDGSRKMHHMDPGNAGWRAFFIDRARDSQETLGWDGIFLDNLDGSLRRFVRMNQVPLKYPTDASYRAAVEEYLIDLAASYFNPQNRPMQGNITELNDTSAWFQYIQHMDGAMNETFCVNWDPGFHSVATWEEQMGRAEQTISMGKKQILVSQGDQYNTTRQEFCYGSYLLIAGTGAAFRYSKSKNHTFAWLFNNYNYDLGSPRGQRYQDANGLWHREFTKGSVVVNPVAHTAQVTSIAGNQADLSWSDIATNEDGFVVERSPDGVDYAEIATLPAGTTSYSDNGLNSSQRYYYRIRAYNSEGYSAYSSEKDVLTHQSPPAEPGNATATAASSVQVNVSWSDDSSNEDGFQVERSLNGVDFSIVATTPPGITNIRDLSLTPSTGYHYRVSAFNSGGRSSHSAMTSASTRAPATSVPGAPTNLTANPANADEINLSWIDNAGNEDGFKVERSTNGTTFTLLKTIPAADVTDHVDAGLEPSTTYYYRLRAYNAAGNSPFTNIDSANTTGTPVAPQGPTNLIAVALSTTEIRLTWSDASPNESGFKVERSTNGTDFTKIATVPTDVTTYTNTGLTASTTYFYRVRAYNGGGNSEYTGTESATTDAPPVTIPADPTNLVANAISATEIALAWSDNSNDETGFKIERSADGSSFTQIATVAADTTTYTNTGLTASTTYFYRVRAYNGAGNSEYTGIESATTDAPPVTIPADPTNLVANAISATEIALAWSDNSNDETGFKIERSADGSSFTQIATVAADTTTFSNTGLTASTSYTYRVRAYNSAGDSGFSNTATATTPAAIPPAPANLTATAISNSQINLAWTDLSTTETGFKIERSADGSSFTQIATVAADTITFSNTGLTASTSYTYRVRAYNSAGNSGFSNTATATTPAAIPPAPANLTATAISNSQINLAWTDPSTTETGFKIERSTDGSSFTQIATVAADTTTFSNTGLTASTSFTYRVRAYNSAGNSGFSNTATATTPAAIPPAPANLTATAISNSQINLAWTDLSTTETGFKIERSTDGVAFTQIATTSANVQSYSSTGLTANKKYYYRVRAYNTAGDSAYTNSASATTLPNAPVAPGSLTASVISSTQINLAWLDNSGNESGFNVERSLDGVTFTQIATTTANVKAYSNTGLVSGTKYYYRVRAYNSGGHSGYSNIANATTTPVAPAAPISLTGMALSTSQIKLTWVDMANNETGFKIERSTNGTKFSQIATVGANVVTYTSSGLTANKTYWYRVRAYNAAGNSAYSNKISVKTLQ